MEKHPPIFGHINDFCFISNYSFGLNTFCRPYQIKTYSDTQSSLSPFPDSIQYIVNPPHFLKLPLKSSNTWLRPIKKSHLTPLQHPTVSHYVYSPSLQGAIINSVCTCLDMFLIITGWNTLAEDLKFKCLIEILIYPVISESTWYLKIGNDFCELENVWRVVPDTELQP